MHAYPCTENANFLLMIGTYIDLAETIRMHFTGMHTRLFSAIKGQPNCFKDSGFLGLHLRTRVGALFPKGAM